MTPRLRAKVFGLNATRPCNIEAQEVIERARSDPLNERRHAYRRSPNPHYPTHGPRTRREFLRLKRLAGGRPS